MRKIFYIPLLLVHDDVMFSHVQKFRGEVSAKKKNKKKHAHLNIEDTKRNKQYI